jgi:hypothetical protein
MSITTGAGGRSLAPGSVVAYHGTIVDAHGHYIIKHEDRSDPNRLVLVPLDNPGSMWPLKARRISVTPTGAHVPVCVGCHHPTELHFDGQDAHCGVLYCDCGRRPRDLWSQVWARA